jgi:hypothetical protein
MTCTADAAPAPPTPLVAAAGRRRPALLAVGPAVADGPAVDAVRAKARAALARRDPISAEVALREALRQGAPADALRADLAAALLARGARGDAHAVLDGPVGFTPDTAALGWRMRGELALAEGRLPQAGQALTRRCAWRRAMPTCGWRSPACALPVGSRPRRWRQRREP